MRAFTSQTQAPHSSTCGTPAHLAISRSTRAVPPTPACPANSRSSSSSRGRGHHQPQFQHHQQQQHRRGGVLAAAAGPGSNGNGAGSSSSSSSSTVAVPPISVVASDVDGTLLNSQQQLTPGVEAAVRAAAEAGVPLIVATGKARGPWVPEVLPRLGVSLPGVFLQGLLIADKDGNILHSRCLPDAVVDLCVRLASQHAMTLTAYCGDRIFCREIDEHTNRLLWYKEPTPEPVGALDSHLLGKVEVHKLIFMAPQPLIDAARPSIEAQLGGIAAVTTALSGMLEVLPLGASKGDGLSWLLDHLDLSPSGLLAMGDGENDIEMLQLAAVSVAMGNAGPKVKAAADYVMVRNDEDGVAQAIQRFVLEPRGVAVGSSSSSSSSNSSSSSSVGVPQAAVGGSAKE